MKTNLILTVIVATLAGCAANPSKILLAETPTRVIEMFDAEGNSLYLQPYSCGKPNQRRAVANTKRGVFAGCWYLHGKSIVIEYDDGARDVIDPTAIKTEGRGA